MNGRINNILFIGGDRRNVYLYERIRKHGQAELHAYGLAFADVAHKDLSKAIAAANVVVLPIPSEREGMVPLLALESAIPLADILDAMRPGAGLVGGFLDVPPQREGLRVLDLLHDEEFQVLNAWPTAEGAVRIALERTERTLKDSRCTVLGYGRIGKALTALLKSFGSEVVVTARRPEQWQEITRCGAEPFATDDLVDACRESHFIFNTIPAVLLGDNELRQLRRDVCIIDLASVPYGVDFNAASRLKLDAQPYPSLPGRMFPKSAAGIVYHCMQNLLNPSGTGE